MCWVWVSTSVCATYAEKKRKEKKKPKDVKKRQKEGEIGWQELRDENWGEVEEKKKIPLAPIILAMEQKAMHKAKRISEEGKGKWFGKGP